MIQPNVLLLGSVCLGFGICMGPNVLVSIPARASDTDHESQAEEQSHNEQADDPHLFVLEGVEILHPWTRATPRSQDGLVFMEIENQTGEPLILTGGRSEAAASIEIVGAQLSGTGQQEYVPLGPLEIPPGDFDLDPNGVALRLSDLSQDLVQGNRLVVVVEFESQGEIRLEADIESADATQHSHAGHAH